MTYSSSVAASRRGYIRRNQNSVSFNRSTRRLGPISNSVVLLLLACMIGLLYLTQVTRTNVLGYSINNLQKEHEKLKAQQADLEVSAARLQSLERVADSSAAKGLASVPPAGSIQ